ncbi:5'-3' exoribonuclease 1 [Phytophthora cinnamomi]|uniref:5'-3' exoribonuclease 1 n=1 Tax=Phytophthora cinnamomi TaxID=4785 RepID=UPI003559C3C6|nr:5'-3' exoribonuclease 1 [Phytophthora cinnamomi]
MGIPRFYRYMSERYPLLNQPISDVSLLPQFDAFYLDMNGIVHNCTHADAADDARNSLSLQGQLHGIFTYLDRLISHIVKPQRLVYIAIDGVAPRAKLNQQRSRRFRAGLDRQQAVEKERYMQIRLEDEKNGARARASTAASKFDSNCITPGTEFLSTLSQHLVYFVRHKMKTDPLWARLEVFFSGSEVPGEGEHKIVEFIRHRKMAQGYEPNMRHCMYGSDADLMLLGLMTHEPHFTLVRETVVWGSQHRKVAAKQIEEQQWQLVHLSLFREYLMMEMKVQSPLDGERMLDDFILLTFLLGNDFIPHSPTLEISEDAIPLLLKVYRELLENHKGSYLTLNGKITNIKLLQELFQIIGNQEEEILINRAMEEKRRSGRRGGRQQAKQHDVDEVEVQKAIMALRDDDDDDLPPPLVDDEDEDEEEAERALLEALDGPEAARFSLENEKEDREVLMLAGSESFQDTKWNYYERKYGIKRGNGDAGNKELEQVKKSYMEALVWCLAYYFQGPQSWAWYYPYHYAPMVSDLTDIEDMITNVKFDEDPSIAGPLLPFEQLMSNLPASSANLVPEPYRFLMMSPLSPIKHFYPETFAIDMEGKRNAWEGVNLLPFIDVALLKQAIAQYCPDSQLTEAERRRNKLQHLPIRIVRDLDVLDTLKSTLPGVVGFPDVLYCNTRVEDYDLPPIPGGEFKSRLMDGVVLPLAGYPSLYTVPLESTRIASVGLNCFGMSSRKSSLILQLPPPGKLNDKNDATADDINPSELLGTTVLANWPNLHEVLVVGISTLSGEYRLKQSTRKHNNHGRKRNDVVFTPYGSDEKSAWAYYAQTEVVKLLSGRGIPGSGGIDLGKTGITTVLHVLPLQGMVSNPLTGAIEKKFGETEAFVPAQLSVRNRKLLDARFEESGTLPLNERFPVDSKALITRGKWLGCTAIVRSQDEEQHTVTVHVNTIDQEPPFGYVIAQKITDKFFPGYLVAQKLGISASTLGLITGSVIIKPSGTDVGLNIRYRKELLLPGYCRLVSRDSSSSSSNDDVNVWRKGDIVKIVGSSGNNEGGDSNSGPSQARNGSSTAWEYTERAVQVIAGFQKEFPEVVRNLSRLPFATTYQGKDVFGIDDAERVEVKTEAVKQWIEQQRLGASEHSKHIPITSEYIAANAVRAMEAAGTLRASERAKATEEQRRAPVVATVTAAELFRPNPLVNQDLTGHEVSQRSSKNLGAPNLGDRVINISARGVPFGHRGTVVATHVSSRCVEVLFDESFTGGEALFGTTSLDRGKIVAWNNLLCVSVPPGSKNHNHNSRTKQTKNGSARHNNDVPQQRTSGGVPIISTNTRVPKKILKAKDKTPAAPPGPLVPPPIPSAMPAPPNPEKIQQLIQKWSYDGEVATQGDGKATAPKPKSKSKAPKPAAAPSSPTSVASTPVAPVAPTSTSEQKLAPSVAALFSAAEAATPSPPAPAPVDPLMGLFPHMYDQSSGAPSLLTPPLPTGTPQYVPPPPPAYYGAQPPLPGQQPQLFLMPDGSYAPMYAPPPPGTYAPQQPQPPMPPSEEEYPPLGAVAPTKSEKKSTVTTETPSDATKTKRHSRGGKGKKSTTTMDEGNTASSTHGAQKKWMPKQNGDAKSKGPQLLLPSQVMRQQKPQQ